MEQRPPTEDDRRETDRREGDVILSDQIREFMEDVKTFIRQAVTGELVLADGRSSGQILAEHDSQVVAQASLITNQRSHGEKLDRVVTILEGAEIRSAITGIVVGHEDGLLAKVTQLTNAISGHEPLRVKREWTQAQQWAIGIGLTIAGGILLTLIPIAIGFARAAGLPTP